MSFSFFLVIDGLYVIQGSYFICFDLINEGVGLDDFLSFFYVQEFVQYDIVFIEKIVN